MRLLFVFPLLVSAVLALTDSDDVAALQTLYSSLGSPSSLTSWISNNGDPCGQSWKGIVCTGANVTEINLPGLGLTGQLSYNLGRLTSLVVMDFSNNQLSGNMPYSLPPNLQTLNLGSNSFIGGLPYSISTLTGLVNLYAGNNHLSGNLQDMFSKLGNLTVLDVSFNNMSGQLPQSFSALYNLKSLYLQNNHFTGNLNVLATLQLQDLNVENNQFSGWIPGSFSSIPNLKDGGNSLSMSPAPPPPPFTPPPPVPMSSSRRDTNSNSPSGGSGGGKKASLNGGAIAGLVFALIVGVSISGLIAFFLLRKFRDNANDEEKLQATAPVLGCHTPDMPAKEKHEFMASLLPPEKVLKPPPSEGFKEPVIGKILGRKTSSRRGRSPPISASAYSVADLQLATDSFSREQLIGVGALGPVYKGELPDGKLLAVKKIDNSAQTEEEFMEIVSNISRLRHANLAELEGYCMEHGQRLLVYEYFRRGTLSDALHAWDKSFRSELTWNIRVKIALGTARALEYLHEVCQPAVIHKKFKSANVLLDDELNPHLSDCGIVALSSSPDYQASTTVAPSGYSAPECTMSGVYTWQSDVYGFGVVMLELLTGRKPMDSARPRQEQSLVRWATPQLHDIDALASMVDPSLSGMYPAKSLSRFADIIALCVQPEMEFRPPMSEVVQALVRLVQRATLSKRRPGEEQ